MASVVPRMSPDLGGTSLSSCSGRSRLRRETRLRRGLQVRPGSSSVWPDWATFLSLWQQLFCPNCYILGNLLKVPKSFIFLVKSVLGHFLWTFDDILLVTLLILQPYLLLVDSHTPSLTKWWTQNNGSDMELFRRRKWTTGSAQHVWNNAMHVLHNFWEFVINTLIYDLGPYSLHLLLLKSSMGQIIISYFCGLRTATNRTDSVWGAVVNHQHSSSQRSAVWILF